MAEKKSKHPSCKERCQAQDRKSTRLNSSHLVISYAVFCLKKKKKARDVALAELARHQGASSDSWCAAEPTQPAVGLPSSPPVPDCDAGGRFAATALATAR